MDFFAPLLPLLSFLLITLSIGALVGCLIPAVIFRALAHNNEKLEMSFETSYTTMLIGYLVTALIALPALILLSLMMEVSKATFYLLFIPLFVVVNALVISRRHRLPIATGAKLSGFICGVLFVLGALSAIVGVMVTGS